MDDPLPSGNSLVSAPSGVGSSDDVDEVELKEQPSAARQAQTSFLKTTSCESSAASMSRVVRVQQSVELGQQPSTNWSPTTSVVALLDAETAPKFDFLLERERGKKEAPVVMNKRIITKVEDAATQVTPKIAAGGGFKFMARNNADQPALAEENTSATSVSRAATLLEVKTPDNLHNALKMGAAAKTNTSTDMEKKLHSTLRESLDFLPAAPTHTYSVTVTEQQDQHQRTATGKKSPSVLSRLLVSPKFTAFQSPTKGDVADASVSALRRSQLQQMLLPGNNEDQQDGAGASATAPTKTVLEDAPSPRTSGADKAANQIRQIDIKSQLTSNWRTSSSTSKQNKSALLDHLGARAGTVSGSYCFLPNSPLHLKLQKNPLGVGLGIVPPSKNTTAAGDETLSKAVGNLSQNEQGFLADVMDLNRAKAAEDTNCGLSKTDQVHSHAAPAAGTNYDNLTISEKTRKLLVELQESRTGSSGVKVEISGSEEQAKAIATAPSTVETSGVVPSVSKPKSQLRRFYASTSENEMQTNIGGRDQRSAAAGKDVSSKNGDSKNDNQDTSTSHSHNCDYSLAPGGISPRSPKNHLPFGDLLLSKEECLRDARTGNGTGGALSMNHAFSRIERTRKPLETPAAPVYHAQRPLLADDDMKTASPLQKMGADAARSLLIMPTSIAAAQTTQIKSSASSICASVENLQKSEVQQPPESEVARPRLDFLKFYSNMISRNNADGSLCTPGVVEEGEQQPARSPTQLRDDDNHVPDNHHPADISPTIGSASTAAIRVLGRSSGSRNFADAEKPVDETSPKQKLAFADLFSPVSRTRQVLEAAASPKTLQNQSKGSRETEISMEMWKRTCAENKAPAPSVAVAVKNHNRMDERESTSSDAPAAAPAFNFKRRAIPGTAHRSPFSCAGITTTASSWNANCQTLLESSEQDAAPKPFSPSSPKFDKAVAAAGDRELVNAIKAPVAVPTIVGASGRELAINRINEQRRIPTELDAFDKVGGAVDPPQMGSGTAVEPWSSSKSTCTSPFLSHPIAQLVSPTAAKNRERESFLREMKNAVRATEHAFERITATASANKEDSVKIVPAAAAPAGGGSSAGKPAGSSPSAAAPQENNPYCTHSPVITSRESGQVDRLLKLGHVYEAPLVRPQQCRRNFQNINIRGVDLDGKKL